MELFSDMYIFFKVNQFKSYLVSFLSFNDNSPIYSAVSLKRQS